MKFLRCIIPVVCVVLLNVPHSAWADVTIDNQDFQSGQYAKDECKPEGVEGFNECLCLADVHVPFIKGMQNADKEKELNEYFRGLAEKQKCEGKATEQETTEEPATSTYNFEVSYQSPALLGLRFESWTFTGGAHGDGQVDGKVIDLAQGKVLGLTDIFAAKDLPTINKYIYDALSAEPEGEVFHDAIEGFKGEFITATGCKSCTVVLAEDGIKVIFQTYSVASFANGPMEVLLSDNFVSNPLIAEALKHKSPPAPEQK
jgi:hypothetical protein